MHEKVEQQIDVSLSLSSLSPTNKLKKKKNLYHYINTTVIIATKEGYVML